MEACYHNCLVRAGKSFILKLITKFSSAAVFIPFLLISSILTTSFFSTAFSAEIFLTPEEQAWLTGQTHLKFIDFK